MDNGVVLFWEDVAEGSDIPPLAKQPTTRQLVEYAAASGDFYEIHYDKDFALAAGLKGVILHGALRQAFVAQLITDWIGEHGTLKSLKCQYRGMDSPGDTLTCKGKVTSKRADGHRYYVECETWIEGARGERTTVGSAIVLLPSRADPLSLIHPNAW